MLSFQSLLYREFSKQTTGQGFRKFPRGTNLAFPDSSTCMFPSVPRRTCRELASPALLLQVTMLSCRVAVDNRERERETDLVGARDLAR